MLLRAKMDATVCCQLANFVAYYQVSLEEVVVFWEMLCRGFFIELYSQPWLVCDFYEPVFDDGFGKAFNDVVPPLGAADRVLEGDVVPR